MFLAPRFVVILLLATTAAVLVPGRAGLAVLAADVIVVGLALLDVALAVSPGRVVRARLHPPVASVGGSIEVTLVVDDPRSRPIRTAVRDAAGPSLNPDPPRVAATIPPGTSRLTYDLRPSRRGRFALGPVTVRVSGPLGLAGKQRTVPLRTELKIYPALRGREQVEGRIRRYRLLEVGTRSALVRGGGLEFDSLRDYHPDDEFRRINWLATARAARPVSNVYREERNQQVLLLLDAGRTMAGTVAGAPRFEHALDAAVALGALAVGVGDRVGAFAFESRVVASVPPRSDRFQVGRMVEAMFDVEPSLGAADYRGAVGAIVGRYRRRALVVLFTDLADEAAIDTLLEAIPALARRHLVTVVEVADPELERLERLVPDSAEEAFRKAAAAGMLGRREAAGRRLARLGATVLDHAPGTLAPALADAYLRAKAYGRL
jgi:uncharacterized protein (DUF58 family)